MAIASLPASGVPVHPTAAKKPHAAPIGGLSRCRPRRPQADHRAKQVSACCRHSGLGWSIRSILLRHLPQHLRGKCIGREKRFHGQFLQGHIHRGAEYGRGADEGQHAMHAFKTKRHHDPQHFSGHDERGRFLGRGIFEQLCLQGQQGGVGRGQNLLAQALEEVVAPLGQIGDA